MSELESLLKGRSAQIHPSGGPGHVVVVAGGVVLKEGGAVEWQPRRVAQRSVGAQQQGGWLRARLYHEGCLVVALVPRNCAHNSHAQCQSPMLQTSRMSPRLRATSPWRYRFCYETISHHMSYMGATFYYPSRTNEGPIHETPTLFSHNQSLLAPCSVGTFLF